DLVIDKAVLTLRAVTDSKVYDGKLSSSQAPLVSGLQSGDQVTQLTQSFTDKNAGTGKELRVNAGYVLADGNGGGNYIVNTENVFTGEITKAQAVVTANSANTVYNGQTQSVTGFTASGLVAGETESVLSGLSSVGGQGKNAGSYTHRISGSDGNYALTFVDGALTIAKAQAVVTANSASTVYNGQTQSVTGFTASGLVAGETEAVLTGLSSTGGQGRNAGRYVHQVSGADGNYVLTFVDGALTVEKAQASVSGVGSSAVYNGLVQTQAEAVTRGFVAGDDVVIQGLASGRNAGTYDSALQVSGRDAGNYNITVSNASLRIDPKAVQVTGITAADKVYDGSTAASIGFGSVSGTVLGETLFVSGVGAFDDKNVGQGKTVTVADATALTRSNGTGDWLNYRLVSTGPVSTQAAITPKLLTVVGTTVADKVFDGNTRALASAGTLQGLVGLETLVFASLSAQFQDAAVGTGKPVSVSYGLGDGLNGGLATNYRVAGTNHSASITASSRRPDDPKPIPPNDRDPSRIIDVRPTGAGVPNLCNEEHLDDADTTQIGLTEDKIKQCSCDLTEVNGVYLCYTPRAEESAKKEKRS
ncbi:MAG: YDG domain-containing protein, partial [Paucibacter sp.]|nr:YDG domain-containing protein [Roseateles sp.]